MKCQILFPWKSKTDINGDNLHEMSNPISLENINEEIYIKFQVLFLGLKIKQLFQNVVC